MIDSLKFLQMKLAKLPKVFGLHETKGWYPHLFNKKENWNYIRPYPDKKYFGVDLMNEQETLTFTEWYNEKVSNNVQFDFQQEIEYYCLADVNILREACLQYRNFMLQVTQSNHNGKLQLGIDVWKEITIASLCSQAYRTKFLEESWRVKIKYDNAGADIWVRGKLKDGVLRVQLKDGSWLPEIVVNIVEKTLCFIPCGTNTPWWLYKRR